MAEKQSAEAGSPAHTRAERGRATRERLTALAVRLFAEHGYEGTSIETVLRESGLSRGALYHHFPGKDALFEAALEAVETDIARQTGEAAAQSADATEALRAGCLAWVRLAGDPVVRRIVLIDAPSVLGWTRWREIEQHHGLGQLMTALQAVAADGRLPEDQVELFAHILLAALNELALLTARADDTAAAIAQNRAAVEELLNRLLGA